ncbi:MAG: hypothetical protein IT181_13655 [Acidobacteria bacterium]|nr:hypothetical protein [Acidobacteriota bacterium]
MKSPKSPGNLRAIALGGKAGNIKSFTQGHPAPGVSSWKAKNDGGGKMNLKVGKKG